MVPSAGIYPGLGFDRLAVQCDLVDVEVAITGSITTPGIVDIVDLDLVGIREMAPDADVLPLAETVLSSGARSAHLDVPYLDDELRISLPQVGSYSDRQNVSPGSTWIFLHVIPPRTSEKRK